ncbi:WD40 domain containing protein [Carpediemonas membranifera]|uniref:WD40 domain containing protein n=1 Tax=Carpediemonas membranifera TaxID=201153 RepID=A0A8J6E4H3_9EUKA|nr:WD40 domain containing protein [Carpediemonas membranifera]|eukprot:KAG9397193.1 WD40 domain containing protein [Carpediemonas membranifera]
MDTHPVVRIEAAFSRSNDCRTVDAQIRTASTKRISRRGIQVLKRGETPITIQDLEKVIQHILSKSIEPRGLTIELTEPAVTVTMVYGKLEADHENNRVELALEAWNTRPIMDIDGNVCIMTLAGHDNTAIDVATTPDGTIVSAPMAVSPYGSTIASGGDNLIKLWDAATSQHIQTLSEHTGCVWSLAFSSDGRTLVSGSWDDTAKVWDVETGQCRLTLTGHDDCVASVAISPDGSIIYSAGWDYKVKQWSSSTGECIRTMDHGDFVCSVAVSPDGAIVASGSDNGCIKFWDCATGQLTRTLDGHTNVVWSLAFSPDGRTLVSGSEDKTIKQWDVATGAQIMTISGHDCSVIGVAFSRDGTTIMSGSSDKTAKVWSILPRTPEFLVTVNELCSSPVAPDADIDPGDPTSFTGDLACILFNFLATGLPRSFTMTLTRPAARVWLDDNKFAKTDSDDAELAKLINLFNECRCDHILADLCLSAVSDVVLVNTTFGQLRQVISRVASSQVAPQDLRITMAAPSSSVIRMSGGLFEAEGPQNDVVDAIISQANSNARLRAELSDARAALSEVTAALSGARTEVAEAKATISSLQTIVKFAAVDHAAELSATLEGHPLFSISMPTPDSGNIPSPAGLISRLGQARRQPERRVAEYEAVIDQARAGIKVLHDRIAAVS